MYGPFCSTLPIEINTNFPQELRAMRLLLTLSLLTSFLGAQSPQARVHAHNDYAQANPFWEAYTSGAHSIEVDLFLKDGTLFVTHEEVDITDNTPSLEALYLKPLQQEYEKKTLRPLQLLLDLKSEARETLIQIQQVLERYRDLVRSGEVIWVISGNRPPPASYMDYPEYIQFDYQSLDAMEDSEAWKKVALISLPFYRYGQWEGTDKLPEAERRTIQETIAKAHRLGKPFRFWATPDTERAWTTFAELGMDFINTDRPVDCVKVINRP